MDDYLDMVERQLAELTASGAHRRPRARVAALLDRERPPALAATLRRQGPHRPGQGAPPPRRRTPLGAIAFAAALAVTVAVVAVALTLRPGSSHPTATTHPNLHRPHPTPLIHHHKTPGGSTTTTTPASTTTAPTLGGPVPRGFGPQSFTAISDLSWWLLGTAPCTSAPCTSIVRTTDGGRSFVGIPAPRTSYVNSLRFANADVGYAVNPQLWMTTDAGAHWQRVALTGTVTDLAIGGGYVYVISIATGTGGAQLYRAPVGSSAFTAVPAAGAASGGLWVHGSDVLLESGTSSRQELSISHDGGRTFTPAPVPPSVACQFEEQAPPVIWEHCATGMLSGVWRSSDEGASFKSAAAGLPEQPNSAAFGSASSTVAVVGFRQLYRTTDGGASWAPVGPSGITWWQYIGFTDSTHGVALGYVGAQTPANERLYYTTDGGQSYHLVPIG